MNANTSKLATGALLMLFGALIALAAFDIGPMSSSPMHAPRWVIAICGLFMFSGGVIVIIPAGRVARYFAGIAVVGITMVCAWIALFGDARYFSTSASLFSRATDVLIARVLFASVAILGMAIAIAAVIKSVRNAGGSRRRVIGRVGRDG